MSRHTTLSEVYEVRYYPHISSGEKKEVFKVKTVEYEGVISEVAKSRFINYADKKIQTAFITAFGAKKADDIAHHRFSHIVSVAKASDSYIRIERSQLKTFEQKVLADNKIIRVSPIALDEMLWMRRNKRIENREKDKKDT